jgi:NADH dehydrogenase (ubiquinone) Fe-S protein 1
MRRQLLRSTRRLAQANAVKQQQQRAAFSTSRRRQAEVELTVDGKKVSIEGMHGQNGVYGLGLGC